MSETTALKPGCWDAFRTSEAASGACDNSLCYISAVAAHALKIGNEDAGRTAGLHASVARGRYKFTKKDGLIDVCRWYDWRAPPSLARSTHHGFSTGTLGEDRLPYGPIVGPL